MKKFSHPANRLEQNPCNTEVSLYEQEHAEFAACVEGDWAALVVLPAISNCVLASLRVFANFVMKQASCTGAKATSAYIS